MVRAYLKSWRRVAHLRRSRKEGTLITSNASAASAPDVSRISASAAVPSVSRRLDTRETLKMILDRLDDLKAEDTVTIDLTDKSTLGDYMVVTSGRSNRHVGAIADHVMEGLNAAGIATSAEGMPNCDWVLIDAGDVIVHVFRPEVREFYSLERMWAGSPARRKAG
jgi:ribosome-associated protein